MALKHAVRSTTGTKPHTDVEPKLKLPLSTPFDRKLQKETPQQGFHKTKTKQPQAKHAGRTGETGPDSSQPSGSHFLKTNREGWESWSWGGGRRWRVSAAEARL